MMTTEIFTTPMVLVDHNSGIRLVVYRGSAVNLPDGTVRLEIQGQGQDPLWYFLEEMDDVSISEIGGEKVRINFNTDLNLAYTIRPVKDEDAVWILDPFGVPVPAEALEKVLTIMDEEQKAGEDYTSGVPSVSAITEGEKVVAVIFNISDVGAFYRVDGAWTSEPTVDLEDTEATTIEPSKVKDFVTAFDNGDESLFGTLSEYAAEED